MLQAEKGDTETAKVIQEVAGQFHLTQSRPEHQKLCEDQKQRQAKLQEKQQSEERKLTGQHDMELHRGQRGVDEQFEQQKKLVRYLSLEIINLVKLCQKG